MTVTQIKTDDFQTDKINALISGYNKLNAALATAGFLPHHSAYAAAVPDTGTADLAATIVIANALRTAFNAHVADVGAHLVTDVANATAAAVATDQGTVDTLLTDIKAKFNLHIAVAAAHRGLEGQGDSLLALVTTADAVDLATSKALAAALLLAFNRHAMLGAPLIVNTGT